MTCCSKSGLSFSHVSLTVTTLKLYEFIERENSPKEDVMHCVLRCIIDYVLID